MVFPDQTKALKDQDPLVLQAIAVWGESRGEPYLGKVAQAHSVLNRMRQKKRTAAQIILQPWQYSCFNHDSPELHMLLDPVAHDTMGTWVQCYRAASEATAGRTADPTGGATHYVVKRLWARPDVLLGKPKWFEKSEVDGGHTIKTFEIGSHVFAKARW